jgi:hypothetical protein
MDLTLDNARQVLEELVIPAPAMSGRGIVICAGGKKYNTNAYALVRLLRELGCSLPIQLWSLPHEQDDLFDDLVRPYNVTPVHAADVLIEHPHDHLYGWEFKSYAIKWCPFQEVLFIDADCFPIRNPEVIFDEVAFKETGVIFMPDIRKMPPDHKFWSLYQIPFVERWEFESGAIFIDKSRHWREVCIADFINQYGIRFYWKEANMLGDKDSWNASFHITGKPFSMTKEPVHHLDGSGACVLVQHDLQGEHLWLHRNICKFTLYEVNRQLPGFVHEEKLLGFVNELRSLWVGDVPEECPWLVGKSFLYCRLGYDHRKITFGAHGSFTEGGGGRESFYYFAGKSIHVVGGDGELSFVCQRSVDDKLWVGRWLKFEMMRVALVELD